MTIRSQIRITLKTDAGTNGALDSLWIGYQSGANNWVFDGNQKQVFFAGSASLTLAASTTYVSDIIPFPYDSTKNLVIAAHFSGTTVNLINASTSGGTS